jgi:hypothetical protein
VGLVLVVVPRAGEHPRPAGLRERGRKQPDELLLRADLLELADRYFVFVFFVVIFRFVIFRFAVDEVSARFFLVFDV